MRYDHYSGHMLWCGCVSDYGLVFVRQLRARSRARVFCQLYVPSRVLTSQFGLLPSDNVAAIPSGSRPNALGVR